MESMDHVMLAVMSIGEVIAVANFVAAMLDEEGYLPLGKLLVAVLGGVVWVIGLCYFW